MSPDTRFSRATTRLITWPDGERNLFPLQSLVVSLLLSLLSTLVFSRTGGILSHLNSSIHKILQFPRGTYVSTSCSLCFLSRSLQRTQPSVKLLSLENWQNQKSFMQRMRTTVPEHFSFHSALSSYRLFASLALWQFSVSLRPLVLVLGSCPASGASWSSVMPPSLARGRATTTTTAKLKLQMHYYVTKGAANSDVLKVVNRITTQSATCYHKIPLLFMYTEHHFV